MVAAQVAHCGEVKQYIEVRAQYKELADEFFSDFDDDYYEYVKFAMFFRRFQELKSAD